MGYGFVHNGAVSFGCGVPINPQMAGHFYDLKLSILETWRLQDSVSNTFGGFYLAAQPTYYNNWLMAMICYEITPVILSPWSEHGL